MTAAPRLSPAQCRHWYAEQLAPGAPTSRAHVVVRLRGPLREGRLRDAWRSVVEAYPAMRLRFVDPVDGLPAAATTGAAPLAVLDLTGTAGDSAHERAREAVSSHVAAPFDLVAGPVARALLVRLSDAEHLLCVAAHRIALDEAALGLLIDRLGERYAAASADPPLGRPPGADVADIGWWLHDEDERALRLSYWAGRCGGVEPLALPTDRPRPAEPTWSTGRIERRLAESTAGALAGREADAFALVCAAFAAVLARYTGQRRFMVGTDLYGDAAGPRWVGDLGDAVPLRVDVGDDPTFADLVANLRRAVVDATRNRAPLVEIVRQRGGRRSPDHQRLFDVAVVRRWVNAPTWAGEVSVVVEPTDPPALSVDLRLDVRVDTDHTVVGVDYARDLFDAERVGRLLDHLGVALDAGITVPETPLSALPLLTTGERATLLETWQGADIPYDREPVHQQVRRWVRERPKQVAGKLGDTVLTYGELGRRADAVARHLRARGTQREEIVAIALERGLDVLVAVVGVLEAGAAFVVMDPTHPARRLEYILEDTSARVVLTHARHLDGLPEPRGWTPVCLDRDWDDIAAHGVTGPVAEWADHDSLAYVLYTSGSTGKPKGVLVEHGALSNFLLWMGGLFDLGPDDRILQHMALIFDFAEGEMLTALTNGVTLVLAPESARTSPEALGELLTAERITYFGGPPAVLGRVPPGDYPDLRCMIAGGEAFTADLVNRWNVRGRRFVNGYGPTEAAVGCIYYECEHRRWTAQPPIGRAMPNRYAYVVDAWDQLAPVGVPGEILVGGAGLARGYLNHPELTAARFIADPFRPAGRVYRTGDLGVWTDDGQIQFLGRLDSQVKLNGLRIELEEIETALTTHPSVVQSVVTLRTDARGTSRLVGYVVVDGPCPSGDELRAHLAAELPPYMVPAQFVAIDGVPLTAVGKVDRAALPAPGDQHAEAAAFVPPRTATERLVSDVLSRVLGIDRLSVHDDFFELGGHSLALLRAVTDVEIAVGVTVPLQPVHDSPTVATMAGLAERLLAGGPASPVARADDADTARLLLDDIEAMSDEDVARLLGLGGTA